MNDSLRLSFDLKGDLTALREATQAVFQEMRGQLERYYGLRGENVENAEKDGFTPPVDSTAQQLLEFFSPANTAKRIVAFGTNFFPAFQQNNRGLSGEEQVNQFSSLITQAIQKGFDQAEKILGGFDNLGETGKLIKKTYEMVLEGIEEFRREHFNKLDLEPEPQELQTPDDQAEASNPLE